MNKYVSRKFEIYLLMDSNPNESCGQGWLGGATFFFLFSLELFLFGIFGCEYVKMTCTSMNKPWVVDVCVHGSRTETAIPCPLLN